jgi:hypothetical protein
MSCLPKNPPPEYQKRLVEDLKEALEKEKAGRRKIAVFALFFFAFFLVDTFVYLRGHNTFFWEYKTPNEIEYQRKILGLDETSQCP